jgi:hypothetical protein
MRWIMILAVWQIQGLSVEPKLEMAAMQARVALVRTARGRTMHYRSRNATGIHQYIEEAAVSGILPTVRDHSTCNSMGGPNCMLLRYGETSEDATALLDGVLFGEGVLKQWDTMVSVP